MTKYEYISFNYTEKCKKKCVVFLPHRRGNTNLGSRDIFKERRQGQKGKRHENERCLLTEFFVIN